MMRQVPKYILAYLLWAVSIALGFVVALIIRQAISGMFGIALLTAAPDQAFDLRMQSNAVDRFGVILLGIGLLVLIVAAEHLYRTGVHQGRLARHFFLITAIELVLLLLANTILLGQSLRAGIPVGGNALVEVLILALVVLFIWLYRRQKTRPLLPI
jgi:predicted lysophospholipase L1 biosynthesis ABC-type transport system permease subunit